MMRRSRVLLAATALALALTGCGADTETPAAAPPPSLAASPSADVDRDACHAVSTGPDFPTWEDAVVLVQMAATAAHAPNPGIAAAGDKLAEQVVEVQAGGMDSLDANLALMRAHLNLAEACGHRFGDGPW